MTAQLTPTPVQKFFDNNGNPLFNGQLFTYIAGTTTPQATYVDATLSTPNTNPIIFNSRGEANIWLDSSLVYKFILKDSSGNQIWSVDNIRSNGAIGTIQNISSLRSLSIVGTSNFQSIVVDGYYSPGDGGGGLFYWDNTSVSTDNNGTIIQPNGVLTGRWIRIYQLNWFSVKWFGAKGDGSTDDTTTIQNTINVCVANSGGKVYFPQGIYKITSTLSIHYDDVVLCGSGAGSFHYAGTTPTATSILSWAGVSNGTMVAFDPTYPTSSHFISNSGFYGIYINGNSIAGIGVGMYSCRSCIFKVIGEGCTTTLFQGGVSLPGVPLSDTADCQQNTIEVIGNMVGTAALIQVDGQHMSFTGYASGTTLTVTAISTPNYVVPVELLIGTGFTSTDSGVSIQAYGTGGTTGTGGLGTYSLSGSLTQYSSGSPGIFGIASADFSSNIINLIDGNVTNGTAVQLYNCDNNIFLNTRIFIGGSGSGITFNAGGFNQSARQNYFYHVSSNNITAVGTASGTEASILNVIFNLDDQEGGSGWIPTIQTGASLLYRRTSSPFWLGSSGTNAATATSIAGTEIANVITAAGVAETATLNQIEEFSKIYAASGTNTYTITPSPAYTALTSGMEFACTFTINTAASTLNVNGLGAINITMNINGTQGSLVKGELSGGIKKLKYDGIQFQLLNPAPTINTFSASSTDITSGTPATWKYSWDKGVAEIFVLNNLSGTAASTTTFVVTGLPAIITPATNQTYIVGVIDNGTITTGLVQVNTNGTLTYGRILGALGGFTSAAGTRGVSTVTGSYIKYRTDI